MPPCLLGQVPGTLGGDAAQPGLQPEETSPGVLPPDGRAGGGVGRRRLVRLVLADAEHDRRLVPAHAEESFAADLPDRDMEPEVAGLLDLGERHDPTPDVVSGGHTRTLRQPALQPAASHAGLAVSCRWQGSVTGPRRRLAIPAGYHGERARGMTPRSASRRRQAAPRPARPSGLDRVT